MGGLSAEDTAEIVEEYALANLVRGVSVDVSPDPTRAGLGEPITVSVSVNYEEISFIAPIFFPHDATLSAKSTMRKERAN